MSDNNSTDTQTFDIDDLDALSANLFGQEEVAKPAEESASSEETAEAEVDPNETDGDNEEVETEESDSDSEDAPEEPENEKPKKGGRFQERINELTTARREAERREQDAINRIAALEARLSNPQKNEDAKDTMAPAKAATSSAPAPTDKNDDGSDKYELGEFDPKFVRDLTRYEVAEATREQREQADKERADRELNDKAAALGREWESKLAPAQERYPDYDEKAKALELIFSSIEQSYGEYLAQTLMTMDHGPDVLYYLANNPDEARALVNSGATRATIQLGRLEAKFVESEQEQPQPKGQRVTKAPNPPAHQNKGTGAAKTAVPDDTEDLDAFASKFFKRK